MINKTIYIVFIMLIVGCVGNNHLKYSEKENIKIENCLKNNDAKSCLAMGVLYELSDLDSTEYNEKLLFHTLNNSGDSKISHMMHDIYHENKSIALENNIIKARDMYKRACKYGNSKGCLLAGYQYQFTKKDIIFANNYYLESCKRLENKSDCNMLARLYLDEKNFDEKINYSKGITYLEKSCESKAKNSCMFLGDIYKKGKVVSFNKNKSMNFYLKGIAIENQLVYEQYGMMINDMRKSCEKYRFTFTTQELKKALDIKHFRFRENYRPSIVGENECKMVKSLINRREKL